MIPAHVSIILLNWNGWRDTIECLESLLHQDYGSWDVIICDNASTDDSVERLRSWAAGKVRFVEVTREQAEHGEGAVGHRSVALVSTGGNLGFAGGNNVGIRFAMRRSEPAYLWLLNNDTTVAPTALTHLVARAQSSPNVGAVGATLFEHDARGTIQYSGGGAFGAWRCFGVPNRKSGEAIDLDYITGASILIPASTVARAGLIDEGFFMYGEDVDYSLKIRRAGLTLAHAEGAHVWHKGGASMGHRSLLHDYYAVRNSLHLVDRYYPRSIVMSMVYLLFRTVLPKVVRGEWERLAVLRRAYADYSRGALGPLSGSLTTGRGA